MLDEPMSRLDISAVSGTNGSINAVGAFHGDVNIGVKKNPEDLRREEFESCQQSLYITDSKIDREVLLNTKGKRVPGTCEWITQHTSYQTWLNRTSDSPLLWVSGQPGKGKTIMSIFITEELEKIAPGDAIFSFCSAQDENRNSVVNLLRNLIHQLLIRAPWLIKHTQPYFQGPGRKGQTLSSLQTLWFIFWEIVSDPKLPPMYCLLDGLDECDEVGLQFLVPKLAEAFSPESWSLCRNGLRLVIVSRPSRSINGLKGCEQVNLDVDNIDAVTNDIERFIQARVKELSGIEGFGHELQEHVKSVILSRAEGTFLWAGFALMELSQHHTCTQLLDALERIPLGLSAVYSQIIFRIPVEHRQNSFKILQWVVLAQRPLSLAQLAAATGLVTSLSGMQKDQMIKDSIRLCGPLLKLKETSVNLVHTSARDYLLRKGTDKDPILEDARIKQEQAHRDMARTCVDCISHSVLQAAPCEYLSAEDDPLLEYAITSLVYHLVGSRQYAHELYQSYHAFFLDDSKLRDNWWITILSMTATDATTNLHAAPVLHIASSAVETWIRAILDQEPQRPRDHKRVDERDAEGNTALYYALAAGRTEFVPLLLEGGVNIEAQSMSGDTLLTRSISTGIESLVATLLDNGASIDTLVPWSPVDDECNALHIAATLGNEAIVRLLLEWGANIHATTPSGDTVLIHAARNGQQPVVQLLLDKGADIHAQDKRGRTALYWAALWGENSVVQYLLDRGAHINTKTTTGSTALVKAAENGRESTVRLLIDRGASMGRERSELVRAASVVLVENCGSKALCSAAEKGHAAIVKFLLEKGADPKSRTYAGSARSLAAKGGHEVVIQLLDEAMSTRKRRWL